jgi:hypothetical protein
MDQEVGFLFSGGDANRFERYAECAVLADI